MTTPEAKVPGGRPPGQARPCIRVIDDDPGFASVMREFLTDEGYQVALCLHSPQALRLSQALRPALILLDLRMPQLSGLAILDRLASDPQTRQIPVLICTATSAYEVPVWQEWFRQQQVPVLVKPFDLRQLAAQLEAMLAGQ